MKSIFFAIAFIITHITINAQEQQDTTIFEPTMDMVLVVGGTFSMGSTDGLKNEGPVHPVTLKSFYIDKYEVSQALWWNVMGDKPSYFNQCSACPVENVSREQIEIFLTKLYQRFGKHYRLPTEAEWEYAAMGGNRSKGYKYSGSDNLDEVAWYKSNSENKTRGVGQKKSNELGLYDMSGNVWEMCSDWYDANYYKKSAGVNPRNDKRAQHRVVRGGSWRSPKGRCYSKARNRDIKDHHKQNGGFRIALDE